MKSLGTEYGMKSSSKKAQSEAMPELTDRLIVRKSKPLPLELNSMMVEVKLFRLPSGRRTRNQEQKKVLRRSKKRRTVSFRILHVTITRSSLK